MFQQNIEVAGVLRFNMKSYTKQTLLHAASMCCNMIYIQETDAYCVLQVAL